MDFYCLVMSQNEYSLPPILMESELTHSSYESAVERANSLKKGDPRRKFSILKCSPNTKEDALELLSMFVDTSKRLSQVSSKLIDLELMVEGIRKTVPTVRDAFKK